MITTHCRNDGRRVGKVKCVSDSHVSGFVTRESMAEDRFVAKLEKRRQISITVIGRHSGREITLPVWFVSADAELWLLPVHGSRTQWYRNLLVNQEITIKVGSESRALRVRPLKGARAVRQVIRCF